MRKKNESHGTSRDGSVEECTSHLTPMSLYPRSAAVTDPGTNEKSQAAEVEGQKSGLTPQ